MTGATVPLGWESTRERGTRMRMSHLLLATMSSFLAVGDAMHSFNEDDIENVESKTG